MKQIYQDILSLKKYAEERGDLDFNSKSVRINDENFQLLKAVELKMKKELEENQIQRFEDRYYQKSFYYNFKNNSVNFYISTYDSHKNNETIEFKCEIPVTKNVLEQVKKIYFNKAYVKAKEEAIRELTLKKIDTILSTKKLILEKEYKDGQ
jgi:CRISPR/Cas system endoribonuclease Cas6 (RAMP superfamily)